ncbi:MAG: primase-like DNA-binding domain-containing protein, partial [Bacteroidales bacterium]|nr:primase-like DNA-binding domain-containing protein [Bacteroidales bacterium]
SVDLALRVFRQSQSSVLSFIEEAQLRREFMDGESCRELYHHYKQFCEEMGFKTLNQNNFRKEFADEMQMQIIYTTNGAGTTQQARFKLL